MIADGGEAGMLEGIFTGSLAAGVDKARAVVGVARAGLVEAVVTETFTAQAGLAAGQSRRGHGRAAAAGG